MARVGLELRVMIGRTKSGRVPHYRGFYLPQAFYRLIGEPDALLVESIDLEKRIIVLRAINKPKPQTTTNEPQTQQSDVHEVITVPAR